MFNKRGVSAVIATVLLILLTVTAVAILAGFIVPFVRDSLEGSTACIDYTDYFKFEERFEVGEQTLRYNCYNKDTGVHGAFVKAGAAQARISAEVDGFELVFLKAGGGDSARVSIPGSDTTRIGGGSSSTPSPGEGFIYIYNAGTEIYDGEIAVYPRLKSGKLCEKSDTITLRECGDVEKANLQ